MKNFTVTISPASIFIALLAIALAALLFYLRDLALIVVTAVVIASAMEPGVHAFVRRGVPRLLASSLIYALVAAILFIVLFLFIPPVLSDAAAFLVKLPRHADQPQYLRRDARALAVGSVADTVSSAQLPPEYFNRACRHHRRRVHTRSPPSSAASTSFVLIVVFSFYFSVQETGIDDFRAS